MLGLVHLILMAALFVFFRWRGASFWQAIGGSAPATLFAFLVWHAAPVYKQHARLIAVLEGLDPAATERAALKEVLTTNGLTFIDPSEVKKVRSKEGAGFKVAYAGVVQVLPTLRLEIRFDQTVMRKGQ